MGKVNFRQLQKKAYASLGQIFWRTLNRAKNTEECARFIDGLLLPSEKVMLARRIQIAQKLLRGKSATSIQAKLHVGQATVEKVQQWLQTASAGEKHIIEG